jgi:putative membrane protein
MEIISMILVLLVALEHFYFLVIEMFLWTKPTGLKAFGMTKAQAEASKILAMNMGLYNGFLGLGLLWGLMYPIPAIGIQIQLFFLMLIMIAGVFGAMTANRSILYIQALPAAIAFLWLIPIIFGLI